MLVAFAFELAVRACQSQERSPISESRGFVGRVGKLDKLAKLVALQPRERHALRVHFSGEIFGFTPG